MTPSLVKSCITGAISDSAENLRKLSALRADVSGQDGGNDASLLSCFYFRPPQSRKCPRKPPENPFLDRDAVPPRRRPHSGSQGRTRGFCDLCRQLLLHLLTLQLGHLPLVTLLQDIVHRDDIRYAPGDVKSGRMTEVFSIAICHILCYNALKLKNGTA